jgi:hypothetical protein
MDAGALFVVRHHPGKQPERSQVGRASNGQRALSARMSSQFAIGDIPMPSQAAAGSSLMT